MLGLLLTVAFGLLFAFFATQNTAITVVKFLPITFFALPLYVVVIASMLIGLLIGSIIHMTQLFSSWSILRGKDSTIKKSKKIELEQQQKIRELELENTKLKTQTIVSPKPLIRV